MSEDDEKGDEIEDEYIGDIRPLTFMEDSDDEDYVFYADHKSDSFRMNVNVGIELKMRQDPVLRNRVNRNDGLSESEAESATGAVIWNTSLVLGMYFVKNGSGLKGKRGLELGSGCGAGGILLSIAGCTHVTLTDRKEIMPLLQENIAKNMDALSGKVETSTYRWGGSKKLGVSKSSYDVIIAADCVYDIEIVDPLISSLIDLSNEQTRIYLGWDRSIGFHDVYKTFLDTAEKDFHVVPVERDNLHKAYNKNSVVVYVLRRKMS
jgi:predicted nicotinamide N-methyase